MAGSSGGILREIRKLIEPPCSNSCPDRELLERFSRRQDEAAFAELVRRHGTLVLGVCRRLLRQTQDVEDAFQATFLLLAQKAGSVRKQESVANWLFGVARRVATSGKVSVQRRRRREKSAALNEIQEPRDDVTWKELKEVLDAELARLPEHYRAPVLLCCLEGKSQEEAARELGWMPGTLQGRFYRGRDLLRRRLTRRGISLSAGLFASMVSQPSASAAMTLLRKATIRAVVRFTAGKTGAMSAEVVALAQEAAPLMAAAKVRLGIGVLLALTMIATGASLLAHQPVPSNDGTKRQDDEPSPPKLVRDQKQQVRLDRFGDPLPAGAIARLGTIRLRSGYALQRVAYAPTGKLLAFAAGLDNTIRVWETETYRCVYGCVGHAGAVNTVTFSPNGKTLASSATDKTIRIWDAITGRQVSQWQCNEGACLLSYSPDGKTLAGCEGKHVCLWEVATGKKIRTLQGHKGSIDGLAFSPDSKHLASGSSDDKSLRLWEVDTGKEVRRFGDEKQGITNVFFSQDGKGLVGGEAKGTIRWWDVATGIEIKHFDGYKGALQSQSLLFSEDGKMLFLGCSDGTIRVLDVATTKEVRLLGKQWSGRSMALSPNGKVLASCGHFVVHLWDVGTGKEIVIADGHRQPVTSVVLSADGKTAVSLATDGIRKWDATTGEGLGQIDPAGDKLPGIPVTGSLSLDARIAAVCDAQANILLWDVISGKKLPSPNMGGKGWGAPAFSPSGKMLAAPGFEEGVLWADVQTGNKLGGFGGFPSGQSCLAFSPDGLLLAVGDGAAFTGEVNMKAIHLLDVVSGNEVRQMPTSARPFAMAFSPDAKTLATCQVQWNTEERKCKCVLLLWEVASGRERARLMELEGGEERGGTLAFSADGRLLASFGPDCTVCLWDVPTGRQLQRLEGHHGRVTSLSFSADGKSLASGSVDTSVLVWDLSCLVKPRVSARLSSKELDALWTELGGDDALRAYQAQAKLTAAPEDTLSLLKERLRINPGPEPKGIAVLLADLDADDFAVRTKAVEKLEKLGAKAEPALRKALKGELSAEVQRQVERLLERLRTLSQEQIRALRALEVLERLDTLESRQLLEKLAEGAADAWLTKEAKAIIGRLASKGRK